MYTSSCLLNSAKGNNFLQKMKLMRFCERHRFAVPFKGALQPQKHANRFPLPIHDSRSNRRLPTSTVSLITPLAYTTAYPLALLIRLNCIGLTGSVYDVLAFDQNGQHWARITND